MRLTTLSLRNYRVFRELDLEFPAGLVGVYGANGAGKSSLLESVMWALYGRARTGKGEIRTSGETGECVVELGFEHEENYYLVRRTLSGKNATVRARVTIADVVVADGVTDVSKYLQSVLGLDELAFRSSVFAEQKQLAAFSDQSPDQRRKLVLQLLGITPIEKARDTARADYRQRQKEHATLQSILGTLTTSEERVALAEADAERSAVLLVQTESEFASVDAHRQAMEADFSRFEAAAKESERIKLLGGAARKRRDDLAANLQQTERELHDVHEAQEAITAIAPASDALLDELQKRLDRVVEWQRAKETLASLAKPGAMPTPDEDGVFRARHIHDDAAAQYATAKALLAAARARLEKALVVAQRHRDLTSNDSCPLCGQKFESGFEEVREHGRQEVREAEFEVTQHNTAAQDAKDKLDAAVTVLRRLEKELDSDRKALQRALQVAQSRADAEAAAERAAQQLGSDNAPDAFAKLREGIAELHDRRARIAQLKERVSRLSVLEKRQVELTAGVAAADMERSTLLAELKALDFDAKQFEQQMQKLSDARTTANATRARLDAARVAHARASQQALDAATALAEAAEKQRALEELELDARYLGRTADLLSGFRQAIVAMVGPQLSTHASALFNELTASEYDGLQIDGETYAISVIDGGVPYSSERFSGSEVDLANLALRVAISEQIRFQAGGQVGLLVLDEALASLDSDRKDRMLGALTRLGGRFRQILVVTHSPEVKERLPQAIEVRRVTGRGSTARVIDQAPM